MADSSRELDVLVRMDDLKYMLASNVNVSSYVSVKLCSRQNYEIWKAQILCLLESQKLRGIIVNQDHRPENMSADITRQYDTLVKGWIFGSLSEQVLKKVVRLESAQLVWEKLESLYAPLIQDQIRSTSVRHGFLLPVPVMLVDNDLINYKKELYVATLQGSWWKARQILRTHEDLATAAIRINEDTMLHIAVGMGLNNFVGKLLYFIKNEQDIEKKNSDGQTALHVAAKVGNTYAAKLLVKKRKQLLTTLDYKAHTPLKVAYNNTKLETYVYLLEAYNGLENTTNLMNLPMTYQQNAVKFIIIAILGKQYDLARKLLNMFPSLVNNDASIWRALAKSFPTDLSYGEALIYPSWGNTYQKIMIERSYKVFNLYDVSREWADGITWIMIKSSKNKRRYSWLSKLFMILLVPVVVVYSIYKLLHQLISPLYFLLWKVSAIVVPQIKEIEKKKNEHKAAKKIMSVICDQMGLWSSNYSEGILEAIRIDAYELVDEILSRSPEVLYCIDEEGYNLLELAIINRSEKVYNLLCPIIKATESHKTLLGSSKYNLAHLVGELPPSFVLGRTRGAALQLQRELQWREEVNKLVSPTELMKENINKETPEMVFTKQHENLMKEGESWMKKTAQSSSITAALIVTIVFAAAITVPGGSSQETGIPLFKKETAFIIFAVSNAISLFTATAALLVFLSILTTRFAKKDFLFSLPNRLIFGLCALIVSTVAMIVAFGAIFFLVFGDHRRLWIWLPIIGAACIPIGVILSLQVPLVVDLWISTYVRIFR